MMSEKIFKLDIVAPDRIIYKGRVSSFSAPGEIGAFQVLYNHAPMISSLVPGEMKFTDEQGDTAYYAVSGGFVEVRENRVLALVDAAERFDQIDIERAKRSRSRALDRLSARDIKTDVERAQRSVARANNRIKVAERVHESASVS
jgi:F-type H+-transporting ATPase subunit epsilon